jgi:hypothetical protein
MVPSTFISVHLVDAIHAARPGLALGEPIILTIDSGDHVTQITLFFRNGDEGYTRRLIDAINSVERTEADHV